MDKQCRQCLGFGGKYDRLHTTYQIVQGLWVRRKAAEIPAESYKSNAIARSIFSPVTGTPRTRVCSTKDREPGGWVDTRNESGRGHLTKSALSKR